MARSAVREGQTNRWKSQEIQFEIKTVSGYPALQDSIAVPAISKFGDNFRTQDAF